MLYLNVHIYLYRYNPYGCLYVIKKWVPFLNYTCHQLENYNKMLILLEKLYPYFRNFRKIYLSETYHNKYIIITN